MTTNIQQHLHADRYEGAITNGVKEGFGIITLRDSSTYMGEFHDVSGCRRERLPD